MKKEFFKYVFPSLLAFIFSGLYSVIDGLFIGRNLGDLGLGAIDFAYPLVAFIQATGTGIGIGGAVAISIARGRNEQQKERKYLGNTLVLLAFASFIVTILLFSFSPIILVAFGATGSMLAGAKEYLTIIILGATFQLFATGLSPLIRNYGKSFSAMVAMIVGFSTNILLDWLFIQILGFGLAGGALATIIGQFMTLLICAMVILKETAQLTLSDYKLTLTNVKETIKIGLSPFGSSLSPFVVIIVMNKAATTYGGEIGIAAYTVASYIVSFVFLSLQGIGDGVQPLISFYYGQEKYQDVLNIRKTAYYFAGIIALLYTLLVITLRYQLSTLFGASAAKIELSSHILILYATTFSLMAFLRVTTSFFYATKEHVLAYITIYAEPLTAAILLLFVLPKLFGLDGVWYTMPVTYLLLVIIVSLLLWNKKRGTLGQTNEKNINSRIQ